MHACRWQIAALERMGQEVARSKALHEGERTRQTVEIAGCCMLLCMPTCCHSALEDSHADFVFYPSVQNHAPGTENAYLEAMRLATEREERRKRELEHKMEREERGKRELEHRRGEREIERQAARGFKVWGGWK